MAEDTQLNRLCDYAGLEISYWDVAGVHHEVPRKTKKKLLTAMGYAANTQAAAKATLKKLQETDRQRMAPPVLVRRQGDSITIDLNIRDLLASQSFNWRVNLESGCELCGEVMGSDIHDLGGYRSGGHDYRQIRLELTDQIPNGYHELHISTGNQSALTRLIIAPRQAYLPAAMRGDSGVWGLAIQLYALRRDSGWGIGDYSDFQNVCDLIANAGADVTGINPLHTLFPSNPESASPYSPSSRLFLNPIYIDVTALPEYEALEAIVSDELRASKQNICDPDQVDYQAVWELKIDVLRRIFSEFETASADNNRTRMFEAFLADGGEALRVFCLHQALEGHFQCPQTHWPEGYQNPDHKQARNFAKAHAAEIRFHAFLQWISHQQLMHVAEKCSENGMRVGLYGDLAVGVDGAGADVWCDPEIYVKDVTFGAPPDPLAIQGQNWGLPPFNPVRLREAGYQPFIDVLRASMRYCGAVRIDHVMWLQRMFWIPAGYKTSEGAYMRFPLDDLLAIVALESHRNHCCVIGEDLGTVPQGFRERLEDYGLLCYRLMRFERYENGLFKRPDTYPRLALASFGSHDLPTLAGFWKGRDLEVLYDLGLIEGQGALEQNKILRAVDRQQLFDALADQGLLSQAELDAGGDAFDVQALIRAVHGFLAKTPSVLVMANLEDVLLSERQINVPGTYLEHPNWRLRSSYSDIANHMGALSRIMSGRSRH